MASAAFTPQIAPVDPARPAHGHRVPGLRDCLALTGLLLDYPDDGLVARRDGLLEAARGLPASTPARDIAGFCQWFAAADPDEVRVEYVRTFDHRRRNALYMTFAANGDTRGRGEALLAFKRLYARSGFTVDTDELPDYLPLILQFAAMADESAGAAALAMARPGVELVARSLREGGSPWARLLAAVLGCVPPLDADGQALLDTLVAQGPPTELVGAGAGSQGAQA